MLREPEHSELAGDDGQFDPARQFLNAFHRIEKILRSRLDQDESVGFAYLVRRYPPLTQGQRNRLLDLALLRNAIAHTPYDEANEPYANPRDETVAWIERQVDIIENPPKVLTALSMQPPVTLLAGDRLPAFLKLAGDPTNFSQAPYRANDNGLGLITTNAVARWLTRHYEEDGGYLAGDVSVSDVVEAGAELRDRLELKKKSLRVVDALTILAGGRDTEPPAAIVITETGHCHEMPRIPTCGQGHSSDLKVHRERR